MFLEQADRNGGCVLFTTGSQVLGPSRGASRMVLTGYNSGIALVGDIADAGVDYSPDTWLDPVCRPPHPWDGQEARYWVRLEGVRILDSFDPTRFVTAAGEGLDGKLSENGFCVVLAYPRDGGALASHATEGIRTTACMVNRFPEDSDAGREWKRLDARTSVTYNDGGPGLLTLFARHAASHGGRVIVPVTKNVTGESLESCDEFLILAPQGRWMRGRVVESGSGYERGLMDDDEFSVPPEYIRPTARAWASLSDVESGSDGWPDVSGWMVYRRGAFRLVPLSESLELGRFSSAVAYRFHTAGADAGSEA
ncbi:hypothetical protein ACLUWO_08610 [Pseudoscardovia radai]|uniref:hypothetical protein n=1 Tax=Pseudoscardovia radai TaxID=987066 RepID=UPI003994C3A9